MLHVLLYEPEIPPNTGNLIRLCANTGVDLHLIQPLGFTLEDRQLRRAGLDYHEWSRVHVHPTLDAARATLGPHQLWAFSTKGDTLHSEVCFAAGDALLFGPESRGLPPKILEGLQPDQVIRIPMRPESRSLNLSNAVAVVVYEAWRQLGFPGGL